MRKKGQVRLSAACDPEVLGTMTTRSQLLNTILRTWDQSIEGCLYLKWMIDPDAARALEGIGRPQLEGGHPARGSSRNHSG